MRRSEFINKNHLRFTDIKESIILEGGTIYFKLEVSYGKAVSTHIEQVYKFEKDCIISEQQHNHVWMQMYEQMDVSINNH